MTKTIRKIRVNDILEYRIRGIGGSPSRRHFVVIAAIKEVKEESHIRTLYDYIDENGNMYYNLELRGTYILHALEQEQTVFGGAFGP